MKTLATVTVLASMMISAAALAMPIMPPQPKDSRVLTYNVITEGAKIAKDHSGLFMGSSVVVNYAEQTVTLKYMVAPQCPPGLSCPQFMRVEEIALPIVDVVQSECSATVIAKQDSRPVDGILQQIKIDDFSNSKCQFFVKPISGLQYLTSYVNRMTGKNVTAVSNLKADMIDVTDALPAGEFFNLTGGEYLKGFAKKEKVSSGSITIYPDTVHLEIYNQSNCPMGAMCLVGPTMIIGDFQVESREQTACEEVITAVDNTPGVARRLVVKNYAHSACDIVTPHLVVAEYTSQVVAPKAKPQVARFYFDYAVVPFTK